MRLRVKTSLKNGKPRSDFDIIDDSDKRQNSLKNLFCIVAHLRVFSVQFKQNNISDCSREISLVKSRHQLKHVKRYSAKFRTYFFSVLNVSDFVQASNQLNLGVVHKLSNPVCCKLVSRK